MKSVYKSETNIPEPGHSDSQRENVNEKGPTEEEQGISSFSQHKISRIGRLFSVFQTKSSLNSIQRQRRAGNIDESLDCEDCHGLFDDERDHRPPKMSKAKQLITKPGERDISDLRMTSRTNININNDLLESHDANKTVDQQCASDYDDQPTTSGIKMVNIKRNKSDSELDSDDESSEILKIQYVWPDQTQSNTTIEFDSIPHSLQSSTATYSKIAQRFQELKADISYSKLTHSKLSLFTVFNKSNHSTTTDQFDTIEPWIRRAKNLTYNKHESTIRVLDDAKIDTESEPSIQISHVNYEISPELEYDSHSDGSDTINENEEIYNKIDDDFTEKVDENSNTRDFIKNISFRKGTQIIEIDSRGLPVHRVNNIPADITLAAYWVTTTSKHGREGTNIEETIKRNSEFSTFDDDFFADLAKRSRKSVTPFSMALDSLASVSSFKMDEEDLLIRACIVGDREALRRLIREKANIYTKDSMSRTPLHISIFNQHLEVASLLLRHGANPNTRDVFGRTPLHIAVVDRPNLPCARMLFDHGAEVPERSFPGEMGIFLELIQKAVPTEEELALLDLLIINGNVHVNDHSAPGGRQALHYAAMADNEEMIGILLAMGADRNAINDNGLTPLEAAELYRCHNAATILIIAKNMQENNNANTLIE